MLQCARPSYWLEVMTKRGMIERSGKRSGYLYSKSKLPKEDALTNFDKGILNDV